MKQTTKLIAAFLLLSVTAVSCQNEESWPQETRIENNATAYFVGYSIDGTMYQQTVIGNKAIFDFIQYMVILAEDGHIVRVIDEGCRLADCYSKEAVSFSTQDRTEAVRWSLMMFKKGYEVVITAKDGAYTCTANKKIMSNENP